MKVQVMGRWVLVRLCMLLLAFSWVSVQASEPLSSAQRDALTSEATVTIQQFASNLQATLQAGMAQSGPLTAIPLCHTASPELALAASTGGWQVGRTSLRVRNPDNAPDAWEEAMLLWFEEQLASGARVQDLVATRVEGDRFRVMKAIPTVSLCLHCHGQALTHEVEMAIDQLYPQDQARGYQEGQIRGAFTLEKTLTF